MAIDMSEVRSALNDLIETCKDSQRGISRRGGEIERPGNSSLFLKFYLQRAEFAGELQAEVTRDRRRSCDIRKRRGSNPSRLDRV